MLQTKTFTAGMDSDTSDELMSPGFDRYRLNTRILSNQDGNIGNAVTTNGNTLTPFTLPGQPVDNKVIGSVEDPLRKKIYYFVWNSTNKHSILEYDSVTGGIAIVFQDGIANNTPNILNFDKDHLITGINVIKLTDEAHLLYWTDAYNEPRKINIEKGKLYISSGGTDPNGYVNSIPSNSDETLYFDPRILYRIKQPPLNCPDYIWENTISSVNFIANAGIGGQTFPLGLRTTVEFDIATYNPNNEFNPTATAPAYTWVVPPNPHPGTTAHYNVYASISTSIYVTDGELYLSMHNVTQNIDLTPTITCSNAYPDTVFIIQVSNYDNLNPGDEVIIQINGSDPIFTYLTIIPLEFKAIYIAAPKINHLFKKLFQFKAQFVYDDYEVSAWSPISKYQFPNTVADIARPDDFVLQDDTILITVPTGSSIVKKVRIAAKEVNASDFSLITEIDKTDYLLKDNSTYVYTFTNEGNYVPLEVNESIKLFDNVPKLSKSQDLIFGNRLVDGLIVEGYDNVNIDLRMHLYSFATPEITAASNFHYGLYTVLKTGGLYQFGIVYYDMQGNRSGVANITSGLANKIQPNGCFGTKLSIPFMSLSLGGDRVSLNQVFFDIYNTPPSWATHYQIVRSKNLAIQKYIQFVPKTISYNSTEIYINISNIYSATPVSYKTKYPLSTLVYDWTKGDRIRFLAKTGEYNDTEITSFDAATGIVTIPRSYTSPDPIFLTNLSLYEIYTPALQIINDNELVYEFCTEGQLITDTNGNLVHAGVSMFGEPVINQEIVQYSYTTLTGGSYPYLQTITTHIPIDSSAGLIPGSPAKIFNNGYSVYGFITNIYTTGVSIGTNTGITGTYNTLACTLVQGATLLSTSGDCFNRLQDTLQPAPYDSIMVEAMDASNMFASEAWDYGRPNRIDKNNREITRPSTVIYSEQLVPETFINGLSSVFDTNFETYENKYGGIQKMYAKDQRLILFQELKVGAIPVSQNVFSGTQGGSIVGTSTQILSPTAQYYSGEFGIGKNPESFAVYANSIYFLDMLRCTPIRLGQDGLISLAETGKMNDYFIKKCSTALVLPFQLKVYGVFDVEFGEYIVSFEDVPTVYQGETVAFDEGNNIFSSFYSYLPENMCSNSGGIVTFKNGNLWTHNSNNTQNNFYGNQYTSDIWMVLNENPMNVKIFTAIEEDSKDVWEVPSISNDEGQESNLIKSDFKQTNVAGVYGIEGQQYAPIWKDANTPNVPLGTGLFQGDPMRSRAFRIKLKYSGTDKSKLFSVNLRYIISNLHAR